jgi:menaquinone-9 beta-reductase
LIRLPASTEVAVVGAGPAGTAAAIALRRLGIDVTLIDRAVFPRDKVCGDVILPEAQHTLAELGLDTSSLRTSAYACTGVRYVPARGTQLKGEFRDTRGELRPWWMVRRQQLDAWLLREAKKAGAKVVTGVSVEGLLRGSSGAVEGITGRTAGQARAQLRARVVVGADGASSVVAREVGAFTRQPEHTCIAARAYVEGLELPDPYLEVYTTPSTLPGCAWIAPVGPTSANIGIGVVLSTSNRLALTPLKLFEQVRRTSAPFAARLKNCGDLKLRGWTLPAATEGRPLAGAGWLLVGDAAALVDPFTGHGIQNALTSGIMAAEAISSYLAADARDQSRLTAYEARCRSAFEEEVGLGAFLQGLHSRPWLMRGITASCARHSGLRDTFIGLVGHAAPRKSLLAIGNLARASVRISNRAAV